MEEQGHSGFLPLSISLIRPTKDPGSNYGNFNKIIFKVTKENLLKQQIIQ